MKDFWKMLLAVVCGLLLFGFITFFILSSAIAASVNAAQGGRTVLPRSGVLAIDLSEFSLAEQQVAMPSIGAAGMTSSVSLMQACAALKTAADDPGVKFVFLKTDGNTSGPASLEELRKALGEFRATSGKPVVAYIESPSTGGYWLASVADKVYMTSYQGANSNLNGVSVQSLFLKDLLDKLGVNMQLVRHGRYKSAGEMYTRSEASADNAAQYNAMVKSMWSVMRADIAASRDISETALDQAVDGLKLCLPEDFLREHLVDGILTRQELKDRLASLSVTSSFKEVRFIPFPDYVAAKTLPDYKVRDKVAVIFADGDIVDGSLPQGVAGDRFARIVDAVREDASVKAVVLRVNSPGGSVLASEKIKHELDLLGEEKPLVASYGNYAASGGYWISNNCSKIFSDAVTLTGSIGVFGLIPDLSGTARKAGVKAQSFSSNRHGDMMSLMRPFDASEYAYMERSIEAIYDKFTTIVSEGRGIDKNRVDEIGQGRVWTGADALGIGLVDEIGTLSDAIAYAAVAAGLDSKGVRVEEFPAPLTPFEQVMLMFNSYTSGNEYVREFSKAQVMARMPYQVTML